MIQIQTCTENTVNELTFSEMEELAGLYIDRNMNYAYIMANSSNNVLYVGVTTNLVNRVWQHKNRAFRCVANRYNCSKLVYFEAYGRIMEAIYREKQLKARSSKRKHRLIAKFNPKWEDLSEGWLF